MSSEFHRDGATRRPALAAAARAASCLGLGLLLRTSRVSRGWAQRWLPAWSGSFAWAALVFIGAAFCARPAAAHEAPLPGAQRAPSEELAPMCAPDGASVVAPDDIPEVDRGHFETLPCEAQLLLAGLRPDAPEPGGKTVSLQGGEPPAPPQHAAPPRPRHEGARALVPQFPSRAEPRLGDFATNEGLCASAGHARSLFRPPLARA